MCYGDSNTWGASPNQLPRFGFEQRWPGVLKRELGEHVHVYENGLCGRTTGYTDDVELGRNGRTNFMQIYEMCAPLDLVIIMLGTNDCKCRFKNHPAWDSALNVRQLISELHRPVYGQMGKSTPQVLIIAPVPMGTNWDESWVGNEFDADSTRKSKELAGVYTRIAEECGAFFLDASCYAQVGADCVHLTESAHQMLGCAVAEKVREILNLRDV